MSMAACVPKLKLGLAPLGKHFVNTDGKCWPLLLSAREIRPCCSPRLSSRPCTSVLGRGPGSLQLRRRSFRLPLLRWHATCSARTFRSPNPAISSRNSCFPARESSVPTPPSTSRGLNISGLLLPKPAVTYGAILRQEGSWCRSVQSSLQWLHDTLSLAGPPKVQVACWDAAVSFIRDQPLAWKRLVQRGRNLALLRELWDAEVQQYQGMTFRALVLQGAAVPPDVRNEGDTREVCGPCGCIFQGLREWSHHAFKRHGRIKESRKLATGTQCPVCIRQFACNARLCQHLDHSTSCRWALRNSGVSAHPEPGRGSKKYDDKLQPATQASGPAQRWDFTVGVEEKDSPCKEVLSLLEDLFFSGRESITTREDLLRKYRECFGAVCLQRTRLHATAAQWKQEIAEVLEADEDISVSWAAWHSSAAKLAADVDLVAWLAEDAVPTQSSVATFSTCHCFSCLGLSSIPSCCPLRHLLRLEEHVSCPRVRNVDFSGGFLPSLHSA